MYKKNKLGVIIISIFGICASLVMFFPLAWMIIAGFKPETEVLSVPFKFLPTHFVTESYKSIFTNNDFLLSLLTTFGGAIVSTFLCLFINSLAAYAFARLEFPLKKFVWVYVIITMFIPGIAILVPSFVVVQKLGMLDTFAVLILPGVTQASWIFFIRQFYLGIPRSIEEAAMIDGANRFKIYYYIFLPLSKGPFVIVGIGAFLGYWNAFIWPVMTVSNQHLYQVMQYLALFRSGNTANQSLIMAAASIAALPPLIIFMIFQKHIIQGIKIAGLK